MSSSLCGVCCAVAPKNSCKCTVPPTPLCENCLIPHFSTLGGHVLASLPATDVLNQFCAECVTQPPVTICCCGMEAVMLCVNCVATHNSKFPDRMHIILPIKAKEFASVPGYLDRLTKRQHGLQLASKEANKNFKRISVCEQKVIESVEKALQEIMKYRDDTLRQLSEYRAQLEQKLSEAKAEVEAHIYEDTYIPSAPIARAIWEFSPGRLALFAFNKTAGYKVNVTARLEPWVENKAMKNAVLGAPSSTPAKVNRPVSAQPQTLFTLSNFDTQLPAQVHTQSRLNLPPQPSVLPTAPKKAKKPKQAKKPNFKPASQTQSKLPSGPPSPRTSLLNLSTQQLLYLNFQELSVFSPIAKTMSKKVKLFPENCVTHMSSAAILYTGKVLVCGKKPASAEAYIVDPATGEVARTTDMHTMRGCHGLLANGEKVYAFGGRANDESLAAAEVYSVTVKGWDNLPDMLTPRSHFNPCMRKDFIYIFGGMVTQNCEAFDVTNNTYIPLALQLSVMGPTALAVQGDIIVLRQSSKVAKWRIGETELMLENNTGNSANCWGNMNPVIAGNLMFIPLFYTSKIEQINIP